MVTIKKNLEDWIVGLNMKMLSSFGKRALVLVGVVCTLLLLNSCVTADKRVGIVSVPAMTTNSSHEQTAVDRKNFPTNVAILPFKNSTKNQEAARIVRRTLFNHFASKNYYSLHLRDVDRLLAAAAWDQDQVADPKSIQLLADTLGVDALIFGDVTHYDKSFAVLYSQVSVGVKMRFVDRGGKEIWHGEHVTRKHEGGIPTTPIGLILQAVASALNIQDINLFRVADELGREVIAKIPEPEHLSKRSEITIKQVVHDGTNRFLRYGDVLNIALEGEPGKKGYARIQGVPLIHLPETAPGIYNAQVVIAPDLNLENVVVTGILENVQGVRNERIATTGYLFVDNTPPTPVTKLIASGRDNKVLLAWDSPPEGDVVSFQIFVGSTAQGSFEPLAKIPGNSFEHIGSENFLIRHYQVVSFDRTGNASKPVTVAGRGLPDSRFEHATPLSQILPATIDGLYVLTAHGGPYMLREKTDLTQSGVLLVEPGTEIRLSPHGVLRVQGELKVFGSKKRPVQVGGMDGMPFNTFLELDGEQPVLLDGVEIRQGGSPIVITRGTPLIVNVRILESRFSALEIKGIGQPLVRNSEIRDGHGGVAVITDRARPHFAGNTFINNGPVHMQCSSPYQIEAQGNIWKQPVVSKHSILAGNGCIFIMD